jgi:peptidoglycan/LPS O-acetylase OafA/YrhL
MNLAHRHNEAVCNAAMRWLGKISFSVYLVQFAVIHFFEEVGIQALFPVSNLGTLLYLLCVCAVTLPVSYLTYQVIELRGMALGKRIINSLERQAAQRAPGREAAAS